MSAPPYLLIVPVEHDCEETQDRVACVTDDDETLSVPHERRADD